MFFVFVFASPLVYGHNVYMVLIGRGASVSDEAVFTSGKGLRDSDSMLNDSRA